MISLYRGKGIMLYSCNPYVNDGFFRVLVRNMIMILGRVNAEELKSIFSLLPPTLAIRQKKTLDLLFFPFFIRVRSRAIHFYVLAYFKE